MTRVAGEDLREEGGAWEWVEPDGLGGFAMGTAWFRPRRRYHALLTVARQPPVDRRVLLQGVEEHLESGGRTWRLDSWELREGSIEGHHALEEFALDPFPRFVYVCGAVRLERTVAVARGEARVILAYRVLEAPGPVRLRVAPLLSGRFYHDLVLENPLADPTVRHERGELCLRPYEDEPPLWLHATSGEFRAAPGWLEGVLYDQEKARGYPYREDLLRPGFLEVELGPGEEHEISAGAGPLEGPSLAERLATERLRREALGPADAPAPRRLLARAADRFRIRRGSGDSSVIAGYPWFEDWGRDAFLALPGLVAGAEEGFAAGVLRSFARFERHGLVPNRFGDEPSEVAYDAADAPLLFLLECSRLARAGPLEEALWDTCRRVFAAYVEGTRHGISVDPADGLVRADEDGTALTWMDARLDDHVITRRAGKPVELQGLWMQACAFLAVEAERRSEAAVSSRARDALGLAQASFPRAFWVERAGWLADVVTPSGTPDPTLRPNQLLALCFPTCPLEPEQATRALDAVDRELVTPFGLRTLAPSDPRYQGRYEGTVVERDRAYHQGTVWPWLLGPYGRACLRHRDDHAERQRLRELLEPLLAFLARQGLGNLPEVFDGDPPHRPGGCPAQAWSVGQVRELLELLESRDPWDPSGL